MENGKDDKFTWKWSETRTKKFGGWHVVADTTQGWKFTGACGGRACRYVLKAEKCMPTYGGAKFTFYSAYLQSKEAGSSSLNYKGMVKYSHPKQKSNRGTWSAKGTCVKTR